MSILNLGFQSVGLMRSKMSEEAEAALKNFGQPFSSQKRRPALQRTTFKVFRTNHSAAV